MSNRNQVLGYLIPTVLGLLISVFLYSYATLWLESGNVYWVVPLIVVFVTGLGYVMAPENKKGVKPWPYYIIPFAWTLAFAIIAIREMG